MVEIVAAFGALVSAGMRVLLVVTGALSMALGLLAAAGGVIVLSWPIGSIVTLAVFTGIWLIAVALTEVIRVHPAEPGALGRWLQAARNRRRLTAGRARRGRSGHDHGARPFPRPWWRTRAPSKVWEPSAPL
ncbi:hypothetical protein ACIG3E_22325 [Streptomyces sp. NPDC053474]|uniref:hypothetical protein n=1 Tax=Streptomyces sp. NPDC053474 TaxID=3365704 RepID=UPI0037D33EAB